MIWRQKKNKLKNPFRVFNFKKFQDTGGKRQNYSDKKKNPLHNIRCDYFGPRSIPAVFLLVFHSSVNIIHTPP
jgi:hypothetical protein